MSRIRVGFICGGVSSEHEVSLLSVKNIVDALDQETFEASVFGVDKEGVWRLYPVDHYLENAADPKNIRLAPSESVLAFVPGRGRAKLIDTRSGRQLDSPQVMFPITHGTYGEDGSLQGFLDILGLPYVGSDVLGSAVCMDKDVAKRLLEAAGLKTAPYRVFTRTHRPSYDEVSAVLGETLFVKPANEGSSVGVSKATDAAAFDRAVETALLYDRKLIVEAAIRGREIECSVLGSADSPIASRCGEIVVKNNFYSYDAKYIDDSAQTIIPAELEPEVEEAIRAVAVRAYRTLGCTGLARVDFFLSGREIYVNELNTLPGFTNISMYPKLWEISGLGYSDLISRLIREALQE